MTVITVAAAAVAIAAIPTVAAATTATVTASGSITTTATSATMAGELVAAGISIGPVGWVILGSTQDELNQGFKFDCWKPVLHDESLEKSEGMLLKNVVADYRIKDVIVRGDANFPAITLRNVWDEEFRLDYVPLPSGQITLHAARI